MDAPLRVLVVQTLTKRASDSGFGTDLMLNEPPPHGSYSWATSLAWLNRRREEAWMPVATAGNACFLAAAGGKLMVYGRVTLKCRRFLCIDKEDLFDENVHVIV